MKHISSIFGIFFIFFLPFHASSKNVNMKLYGADDRGKKLNTELINKTITDLSSDGGGTLYFPAGKYLTGAIKLKSNITIELEAGAVLLFSDNFDDYLPFVASEMDNEKVSSFFL